MRRILPLANPLALCTALAPCLPAQAQDPRASAVELVLTAPRLSPILIPAFSPAGDAVAYTVLRSRSRDTVEVNDPSVPWYAVGGDVWTSSLPAGPARSITQGIGNNWAPSWSPDRRRLAFLSNRGRQAGPGSIRLWVWHRTGQLRQAADVPVLDPWGRLGRLEWADHRTVLVKVHPEISEMEAHRLSSRRSGDDQARELARGVTAQVFRSDPEREGGVARTDPNDIQDLLGALALIDVETGAVRRLTGSARICSYALSPDRKLLAWAVADRFERPGSPQILVDIYAVRLGSGAVRRLVAGAPLVIGYPTAPILSWSPDSRSIAYRTDGPKGTEDGVYVVPVEGGHPRQVSGGGKLEEPLSGARVLWGSDGEVFFVRSGALWRASADGTGAAALASAPGRSLYMIEQGPGRIWSTDSGRAAVVVVGHRVTKRVGLARVDFRTGLLTQLSEESRWIDTARGSPPVVSPDGTTVLYVAQDHAAPPDLWLAHADRAARPRRLTRVAPALEALAVGRARIVRWRGLDGDSLAGALIYPARYREGQRYPLVVKVYGGVSISDDLNRFGFAPVPIENLHVYARRGYAVLLADSRLRTGSPMLDLLKTVMPGVNRVVDLGVADPDRLGIMGHSYGGYSTLALLVQSPRFKAAVVRAGFGDLVAAYGQLSAKGTNYLLSWAEQGQGRMGGTPWEVRSRYVENSPILYLDRVVTPVLLIHGGEDRAVPAYLADQVFSGLRRLGKRVEYARYRGERHSEEVWSLANQIDYMERTLAWFDQHLTGQASP